MGFSELFFNSTPSKATFITTLVLTVMFLLLLAIKRTVGVAAGSLFLNIALLFLLSYLTELASSKSSVNAGYGTFVGLMILFLGINGGIYYFTDDSE